MLLIKSEAGYRSDCQKLHPYILNLTAADTKFRPDKQPDRFCRRGRNQPEQAFRKINRTESPYNQKLTDKDATLSLI
jgi:hypothetical protein